MNYNQANFEAKLVQNLNHEIEMIMQCETHVLDLIITFLKSTNKHAQTENFVSFLHLLIKMRFNIEAAHTLMPFLKEDYRFKTSINLLYRSTVDDITNIYYFLGYVLTENSTKKVSISQQSLGNELNILHRDFLKSASKIIESEIESDEYYCQLNNIPYNDISGQKNWKQQMIEANAQLYNDLEKRWRNNTEIRATSSSIFTDKYPKGNASITETGKIEFIQNNGFERSFQLTQLFKYFSQYQHFSPKMHDFLLTTPEHDLEYYHKLLVEVIGIIIQCNIILVNDDKDEIKRKLDEGIVRLNKLYNDYYSLIQSETNKIMPSEKL